MTQNEKITLAGLLAKAAHAGQTRRDKVTPYFNHVANVAARVPDELKPAAYLHDALEDTKLTFETIRLLLGDEIAALVSRLTRYSKDPSVYDGYMLGVLNDPDAARIKLADMESNLGDNPSGGARRRYEKWVPILKASLVGE